MLKKLPIWYVKYLFSLHMHSLQISYCKVQKISSDSRKSPVVREVVKRSFSWYHRAFQRDDVVYCAFFPDNLSQV